MTLKKAVYTGVAVSSGTEETWNVRSDDGHLDVALGIPKSLSGSGKGSNPEQLFAAGFAACMQHTIRFYGAWKKQDMRDCWVRAAVSVGPEVTNPVAYEFAVHLIFKIPHLEKTAAEALVAKAHLVCPYSRMAANTIKVTEEIYAAGEAVPAA